MSGEKEKLLLMAFSGGDRISLEDAIFEVESTMRDEGDAITAEKMAERKGIGISLQLYEIALLAALQHGELANVLHISSKLNRPLKMDSVRILVKALVENGDLIGLKIFQTHSKTIFDPAVWQRTLLIFVSKVLWCYRFKETAPYATLEKFPEVYEPILKEFKAYETTTYVFRLIQTELDCFGKRTMAQIISALYKFNPSEEIKDIAVDIYESSPSE